jgi:hypothetical protein
MILIAIILLALTGLVLIVINARKLISDWPRLKPVHNVDVAWVQIYLGLVLIGVAWVIATRPGQALNESTTFYLSPNAH